MQLDFTRVEPKNELPYSNYRYARHQVQALTAAEEELIRQRREAIHAARHETQQNQDEAAIHKAGMPLNIEWKILTFVFPGMLQLIFSSAFKAEGYTRKAKDMKRWTLMGFVFYTALLVTAFFLSR